MNPQDVPEGPLLVDTDAFSLLTFPRGRHEEFAGLIEGHILALSFATIGELRAGAIIANWGQQRRELLEERIRQYLPIPGNDQVTAAFARVYARYRGQVDVNDIWTVACAISQPNPLPIVTGNLRHFDRMAGEFRISLVHPDL